MKPRPNQSRTERRTIIEIEGGHPLEGQIRPQTAKNSVLPILAATLLCGESCHLRNVPKLLDVETSLALLNEVGAGAAWQGGDVVTVFSPQLSANIPRTLASAMRASVFYLAPLLCRCGQVRLPMPGGCSLGPRPIDIHLAGLAAMGAQVDAGPEDVRLRVDGCLHGADFTLRLPSVGATLTLLMAACMATGMTVLRGVAREPEIVDAATFLLSAGARITGAGSPVIVVHGGGGALLRGVAHTAVVDRIAAATYAAAVAITGGTVRIEPCCPRHIATFLGFLRGCGCGLVYDAHSVTVTRDKPLCGGAELHTAPYPGFATDAAPLAAAVLLYAQGQSVVRDTLFDARFACAAGFAAMGADARVDGSRLLVRGGTPLRGARLDAPDLRGGAALLIAAAGAAGHSTLYDDGHIGRGYVDLAGELKKIGLKCKNKKNPIREKIQ